MLDCCEQIYRYIIYNFSSQPAHKKGLPLFSPLFLHLHVALQLLNKGGKTALRTRVKTLFYRFNGYNLSGCFTIRAFIGLTANKTLKTQIETHTWICLCFCPPHTLACLSGLFSCPVFGVYSWSCVHDPGHTSGCLFVYAHVCGSRCLWGCHLTWFTETELLGQWHPKKKKRLLVWNFASLKAFWWRQQKFLPRIN